jgi:hypothetical protein
MLGNSWAAAELAAPQEGLSSMELDVGRTNNEWDLALTVDSCEHPV